MRNFRKVFSEKDGGVEAPLLQSILDNYSQTKLVNPYAKERRYTCLHCGTQMLQRGYSKNFHNDLRIHLLEHSLVILSRKEFEDATRG